jgi:predicted CxxxxCH...CXXCH cytochrome family protein
MTRGPATLAVAAFAIGVAACGEVRETTSRRAGCTACHGGADNLTGAPPWDVSGGADTAEITVGAHSAHVQVGPLAGTIACTECHPDPRSGSTVHANQTVNVAFGPLAGQGTSPRWEPATATCSATYCHGATLAGGTNKTPAWTRVGAGEAACGTCHGVPPPPPHLAAPGDPARCNACHPDTVDASGAIVAGGKHANGQTEVTATHPGSWLDTASPGFHAYSANAGLATCQACHGQDLGGGFTGVACAQCHDLALPPGVPSWKTNCVMCHGGVDNQTGAPPRTTWGMAGDPIRVGAHTSHVAGSTIAPDFGCGVCHVKPADALSAGHVDAPTATVTFGGLALSVTGPAPQWNRASATCASTYCHGATLAGGSNTTPVWTAAGQAGCGACHGLPPPLPHPAVSADLAGCSVCHPLTVDAGGNVIDPRSGGKHLDGVVEASGGHNDAWVDPASAGFHAYHADRGLSSCQVCHGQNLDGVGGSTAVGCGQCHDANLPPGVTSWRTNCVMCHGGTDDQGGAPPRATWGHGGDPVRVGAHSAHVAGSAVAPPFDCGPCHVKPADALSPGHIDGATAAVTFSGLAVAPTGPAPEWVRGSATCASTYCHGSTLSGGSNTTPVWTAVGQGQAACGTCHGLPPPSPHPSVAGGLPGCRTCHPQTVDSGGNLIPPGSGGAHLDGTVETGHIASWMDQASPDFHAFTANQGLATCQLCHGQSLDGVGGVTTVACASCHGATWKTNCLMCHGGTDNQTGAPPRPTWGAANPLAVGAHSSHVGPNPVSGAFGCAECHATPASALSAGHVDGAVGVAFSGPLSGMRYKPPAPAWNEPAATCSSTYCHGNFLRGCVDSGTCAPPAWTGANQAACGSCHNARPQAFLHVRHGSRQITDPSGALVYVTCSQCHSGIASSSGPTGTPALVVTGGAGPPLHVNGTTDVVLLLGGSYDKQPGTGYCSGTYCHPGEVTEWPR